MEQMDEAFVKTDDKKFKSEKRLCVGKTDDIANEEETTSTNNNDSNLTLVRDKMIVELVTLEKTSRSSSQDGLKDDIEKLELTEDEVAKFQELHS